MDAQDINRFESKFMKKSGDECWSWLASKSDGYGNFRFRNKILKSHRMAWEIYIGKIPHNLFVLHKCDNRSCVNPDHLFLGTNVDNMKDMVKKGRSKIFSEIHSGEGNIHAKLKEKNIEEIRKMCKSGKYTRSYIAEKFNISSNHVFRISHNLSWKDNNFKVADFKINRKGRNNGNSKLTDKQIDEIRDKYKTGNFTQKRLSEIYKVTEHHIQRITKNKVRK